MTRAEVSAHVATVTVRRRNVAAAQRRNAGQVLVLPGITADQASAVRGITRDQVLVLPGMTMDQASAFPGTTRDQVSALRGIAMDQVLMHPGTTVDQVSVHGVIATAGNTQSMSLIFMG